MTDLIPIRRELLEQVCAEWEHDNDKYMLARELRAALAAPVQVDWREHSKQYARGEQCPDTPETAQAAWARDQEVIFDQKAEIAKLKEKVNQLQQKRAAPVQGEAVPAAWLVKEHPNEFNGFTGRYRAVFEKPKVGIPLYTTPPQPADVGDLVEVLRRAVEEAVSDDLDGWYANAKVVLAKLESKV